MLIKRTGEATKVIASNRRAGVAYTKFDPLITPKIESGLEDSNRPSSSGDTSLFEARRDTSENFARSSVSGRKKTRNKPQQINPRPTIIAKNGLRFMRYQANGTPITEDNMVAAINWKNTAALISGISVILHRMRGNRASPLILRGNIGEHSVQRCCDN